MLYGCYMMRYIYVIWENFALYTCYMEDKCPNPLLVLKWDRTNLLCFHKETTARKLTLPDRCVHLLKVMNRSSDF